MISVYTSTADYVVSKWKQIRPPPLTTRLLHNPGAAGIDSTSSPRPALYNSNHSNIMIEGNTNPDPHHSTTTNQQPKYKFKNCFKFQTFKPGQYGHSLYIVVPTLYC